MKLLKTGTNTKRYRRVWFYDCIDCGDFYLLTQLLVGNNHVITPNQNTVLEDLHEEYEGDLHYSKFCKTTFHMYIGENETLYSHDIDEVMNWTKIDDFRHSEGRTLEALVTGEGLEDLNVNDRIIRWPNKKGGRGEHWYWLVEN
jgi:hypothetical protein